MDGSVPDAPKESETPAYVAAGYEPEQLRPEYQTQSPAASDIADNEQPGAQQPAKPATMSKGAAVVALPDDKEAGRQGRILPGALCRHLLTGEHMAVLCIAPWSAGSQWVCRRKDYSQVKLYTSELIAL